MRLSIAFLSLLALITAWMPAHAETASAADAACVAVLPFDGIGARPEDACLSAGLAETLTAALARVHSLRVVERGYLKSVLEELKLQHSGLVDDATARKLGALLGASRLVLGSFQRSGAAVRVTCRLVDAQTGLVDAQHTLTLTREVEHDADLFRLQDEVVAAMLKSFGVTPSAEEQGQISQITQPTTSREAYALYMQGRDRYLEQTIPGFRQAVRLFDQATFADIRFGLAWAGLAEAMATLSATERIHGQPHSAVVLRQRAQQSAQQALALAPNLPESHRAMAACLLAVNNPNGATRAQAAAELQKALSLNARDAEAHFLLWMAQGRPLGVQADHMRTALEINPRLVRALTQFGIELLRARRISDAVRVLERAGDASPRNVGAALALAGALVAQHDREGALAALRRCRDAIGGDPAYAQQTTWLREKIQQLQQRPKKRR